jgi:Na+-transporting NADH:ubiquinone oxidoreductase subunit C
VIRGVVDEDSKSAPHQVDGISGATMTGKGLTNFLLSDLKKYEPFLNKIAAGDKF